jgi:hypothetical protein
LNGGDTATDALTVWSYNNTNSETITVSVDGADDELVASIDLSSLDGSNGFKLSGVRSGDHTGLSVSSAGDVNGDGIGDVIVGAVFADPAGVSYVVYGAAGGLAANIDLASLDGTNGFKLTGDPGGFNTGTWVASAGDINGDGIGDVIVGGPWINRSYVVFGNAGGFPANVDLASLNGSNGFRLTGGDGGLPGATLASAGDVNGDGLADIIIGAPRVDLNGTDSGVSYVVFGRTTGFGASFDMSSLNGSNGFTLIGEAAGDSLGAVASAGDVNGDGIGDLIVGAGQEASHGMGVSYVVFGTTAGFSANFYLSSLNGSNGFKLIGEAAGDLASAVASAGDINGDGYADVIIGADWADPNGNLSGAS